MRDLLVECLLRFDGERLKLHAAVVMPNPVHLILEPLENYKLSVLMCGIKGGSARAVNRFIGSTGALWMDESYDRIIRNQSDYERYCAYIRENPKKAGLMEDEYWLYYSRGGDLGEI